MLEAPLEQACLHIILFRGNACVANSGRKSWQKTCLALGTVIRVVMKAEACPAATTSAQFAPPLCDWRHFSILRRSEGSFWNIQRLRWCSLAISCRAESTYCCCRALEPSYPGRVAPPTWAVNAVLEAEKAGVARDSTPLEEELRSLVVGEESAADSDRQLYNQSGLNGLATSGVQGLQSVRFPPLVDISQHSRNC